MNKKLPIEMVQEAIDALINLEGSVVYPNGLPSCFSQTLSRLRNAQSQLQAVAEQAEALATHSPVSIVHACPAPGSGVTGCCGKPPFELPRSSRMTQDLREVTCPAFDHPPVRNLNPMADIREYDEPLEACTKAACKPVKKRYFCKLTVNGKTAEHQVRITSRFTRDSVYVQRLVKSSNSWGTKRYLVSKDSLREEFV